MPGGWKLGRLATSPCSRDGQGKELGLRSVGGDPEGSVGAVDFPQESGTAGHRLADVTETAPVHVRGVSELFVAKLDDQELAALKSTLDKVSVDCAFG
jgi:hypothetical protein